MTRTGFSHWAGLWRSLGALGDPTPLHRQLVSAYAEKQRHYHTLQHLEECLVEFDGIRRLVRQPGTVEMALWFHDAAYDPRSSRNEEDSGDMAAAALTEAKLASNVVETIRQLILCTKTHESGAMGDGALLLDVDLAILGQLPPRFWAYEQAIRAEYAWVEERLYREKRAEILEGFRRRPAIYRTEVLHAKYEKSARTNLDAAILRLRGR